MTGLFPILALGFFLGMRHATDPDHVIAVTTIVARHRDARGAAAIGALWGVGHTLTIMIVGGGIILFEWVIPARVGLSMELSVGVMLVLLGIMNLRGVLQLITERRPQPDGPHGGGVHSHPHQHGDYVHTHPHAHEPEAHPHDPQRTPVNWLDRRLGSLTAYQVLRPLTVGVVHGLAGSAAVALLVLATIRDSAWAAFYLLIFGLGTVLGMMLVTAAIALPFRHAAAGSARLQAGLRIASGLISLGFGLLLAWQIGVGHGLFTGKPDWTPR
jgi:high-affinity nickel-transport protein